MRSPALPRRPEPSAVVDDAVETVLRGVLVALATVGIILLSPLWIALFLVEWTARRFRE